MCKKRNVLGVLAGHKGSVKSMCSHLTNSDMIVSGSRDGSLVVWDLRCKAGLGQNIINSTGVVAGAHATPKGKRVRLGKAASMSITSVPYLKNEVSIATTGAFNSIVKFWDIRNLNAPLNQACPYPESAKEPKQSRVQTNVCGCSSSDVYCLRLTQRKTYSYYLKAADVDEAMEELAEELADLAMYDHMHIQFWPSSVAAWIFMLFSLV